MIARRLIRLLVLGSAVAIAGCGGDEGTAPTSDFPPPDPLVLDPVGLLPFPEFPDNPLTVQGVALGRRLFHDPILSADRQMSCATCHVQAQNFSDPRRFSVGVGGQEGTRNAPTIVNAAWLPNTFWDGREPDLENQARRPVPNEIEMNLPWEVAIERIASDPEYPEQFGRAFGTIEVTEDRVVKAIAQFQRTFLSNGSRYDRKLRGEISLTPAEARGEALFFSETGECFHCHGSILFTAGKFHDIGLDLVPTDPGRYEVTGDEADRGKFRAPSLRNVEVSAPYMHDGRFATLEDVLDHYAGNVNQSPNLDPLLNLNPGGLVLTEQDKADLIAFLKSLTDPEFLQNPDFGPPE